MKKALLLFWIIPGYLLFLTYYETKTYLGIEDTNADGVSLVAQIDDLTIKNLQAQSNGRIEITFTDANGQIQHRKFSLPIQLAAQLQPYSMIPIRYLESSAHQVVFMPTYEFHKNMVLMNWAISLIGFLFTAWASWRISKYALHISEAEVLNEAVLTAFEKTQKGSV